MGVDVGRALEVAERATRAAAAVATKLLRDPLRVEWKADGSPVTEVDRLCEQAILATIREAFPDHAVLAEESGASGPSQRPLWIIDPIDATRNMVRGLPHFAHLVALEEEGEVKVGVAHAPIAGDHVTAARGRGAFWNGERLMASGVNELADAYLCLSGMDGFARAGLWGALRDLSLATRYQRGLGDYHGHLLVARGTFDMMLDPIVAPWDLAALQVIVEEAGGRFTDFEGKRTIRGGTALSTNGLIHDQVLDLLRKRDA